MEAMGEDDPAAAVTISHAAPCDLSEDYLVQAGILTVRGGFANQSFSCSRGQLCTFDVEGVQMVIQK